MSYICSKKGLTESIFKREPTSFLPGKTQERSDLVHYNFAILGLILCLIVGKNAGKCETIFYLVEPLKPLWKYCFIIAIFAF